MRFLTLVAVWCALAAPQAEDLARQAREAQEAGDYRRAAEAYSKLLVQTPNNAEILSNLGLMLHLEGNHPEALGYFRQALKQKPNLVSANLFGGLSLLRMGEPKQAAIFLERAYAGDSSSVLPALALASAHVSLRNFRRANDFYYQATERDPHNAEGWFGLGITYRNLLDSAVAQIARTNPQSSQATSLLTDPVGSATRATMVAAEKALASQPGDLDTLSRLAQAYRSLALTALNRAVQLDPASERAHLLLAEAFRANKNLAEAIQEYEAAIRIRPTLSAAHLGLATTYWKSQDTERAMPPLKRALELVPNDPEANGIMADLLVRRGEYREAKPYLERALQGNPDLVLGRIVLAKIHMAENRPALAVEELQKSLSADGDGSYHYLLFQALKKLGREEDAKAALKKFQELRSGAPTAGVSKE